MALGRHHVPFDNAAHVYMLSGEPTGVAADWAQGEEPLLTFWAEPGDRARLFRVFAWDFRPAGCGADRRGRPGHGLRWYLYELPGQLSGL